jgi:hypothetical protein
MDILSLNIGFVTAFPLSFVMAVITSDSDLYRLCLLDSSAAIEVACNWPAVFPVCT